MAEVRYGSLKGKVCVSLVPDVSPGDYVIVHVGFAIEKLDPKEAEETLTILREIGERMG